VNREPEIPTPNIRKERAVRMGHPNYLSLRGALSPHVEVSTCTAHLFRFRNKRKINLTLIGRRIYFSRPKFLAFQPICSSNHRTATICSLRYRQNCVVSAMSKSRLVRLNGSDYRELGARNSAQRWLAMSGVRVAQEFGSSPSAIPQSLRQ